MRVATSGGNAAPAPVAGRAIAGFICAFVCAPLGLVLSATAITEIRRTGKRGMALAVIGTAISTLGVIVLLVALGGYITVNQR